MNFTETNEEESKLFVTHYDTNEFPSDVWSIDSGCSKPYLRHEGNI